MNNEYENRYRELQCKHQGLEYEHSSMKENYLIISADNETLTKEARELNDENKKLKNVIKVLAKLIE